MVENENILDESYLDTKNFPDSILRANAQVLTTSFQSPEIPMSMSYMDRQKLLDTLSGVVGTRKDLIRSYDSVRMVDIVQTILSVIINDSFYCIDDNDEIFSVVYDEGSEKESNTQKKVNDIISDFIVKFSIQPLIQNIMEDFLLYGEYPLRVIISRNRKGIIDIREDIDPITTIGVYKINEPLFFLERNPSAHTGYTIRSPKEIVHFNLSPTKIRIKSYDGFHREKIIPEYVRIGKSVIYPALQKIKQLQTIEWSSIITDLKKAIAPILVSVSVPQNSQAEDVTEIIKKYEQHLQEVYRGMPDLENPTIGDMLSSVANFRVIPNFTDGKGSIQTLDMMSGQQDIDMRIDRQRFSIAMSVGMPPYYVVPGQEGNGLASKTEMLKIHTRYSRMLSSIQNAVRDGIRRLVCLHVINKGICIDPKLVKVKFKNIINVEHLDKMEYAVASAQTINDVWNTLSAILSSDEVPAKLNGKVFVEMVNTFLSAGTPIPKDLLVFVDDGSAAGGDGGGGGGGSVGGGDLFGGGGGGGVQEAPMYGEGGGGEIGGMEGGGEILPAGGGAEDNIGEIASDAMENTESIPPPDFGEESLGDVASDVSETPTEETTTPNENETPVSPESQGNVVPPVESGGTEPTTNASKNDSLSNYV